MQAFLIHEGARRELLEQRARRGKREAGDRPQARGRPGHGQQPPREPEPPVGARVRPRVNRATIEGGLDRRINDRSTDLSAFSTQSEVSIAAYGRYRIAAWNDAEWRFEAGPVGYAWSRDGGNTWVDGGVPVLGGKVVRWASDPVVAVNEKTGDFYLCAMVVAGSPPANAVAVAKGAFAGDGFGWESPVTVRAARDTLPDKPWMAVDSLTGNLYVSYTTFTRRGDTGLDQIEFQRSTDDNRTWSPPLKLSSTHDDGLVQGSRPAVGPDGEVEVVWSAVDTTEASHGVDYLRARRSVDGGASFLPEATVSGLFSNIGSGAPGFNRGNGFTFPGIAIDRSAGAYRGRTYVVWQESLDYYDDYPVAGGAQVLESTARPETAWFAVGDLLRGALDTRDDVDLFRFAGRQGESVIFYVDSLDADLDLSLRLLCADGLTRIAYNAPRWRGRPRALIATLPETGTFVVRVATNDPSRGGYRIRTGSVPHGGEPGRDQRDVFVAHSDDGRVWSQATRVNADPPWFDDWLPEIAVSSRGSPYVAWYDWRDSPAEACGTWSRVWLARSDDGGDTWSDLGPLSSAPTAWSEVPTNLSPNQGDYIALFANDRVVEAAWADGREGDPDVYLASRDLAREPAPARRGAALHVVGLHPNPASRAVTIELLLGDPAPVRIDVLDVRGRRVESRTTEGFTGRRRLSLDLDSRLPSGVYFVRVAQSGRASTARIAVVR